MAAPATQYQHPLPSPPLQKLSSQRSPQSQYSPPVQPPKAKTRSFSFRSDKSRNSIVKQIDLTETHEEKDSRRIHSKADPTLAINEAEPSTIAAMMATSLAPLRAIQHKDAFGNVIADPDKSNPTRNRWERPLDTIRSFEAAIDGDYARRSTYRSDMDPIANWNRRNSHHPGNQPRFPQDSYYSSRAPSVRADSSQYGPGTARNSYYGDHSPNAGFQDRYGPPPAHRPSRERLHRSQTEPHHPGHGGREQRVYPMPHKDRSYETVTSAAGSGASEAAGYQTDPTSSDNSSIRRASPGKRREPVNEYGNGYNQQQQSYGANLSPHHAVPRKHPLPNPPTGPSPSGPGYQTAPQAVPRKAVAVLRREPSQQSAAPEKRKSWFARRFSKSS